MAEAQQDVTASGVPSEDREQRIARLLARCETPVKPQYIRERKPAPASTTSAASTQEKASENPSPGGRGGGRGGKGHKKGQKNTAELCNNLIAGECKFGDSCRHNHDVAAYLAQKQADLPGQCPFTHAPSCPYGIQCRWAGSHTATDAMHQQLRDYLSSQAAAASGATAATDAATGPDSATSDLPAGVVPLTPETAVQGAINILSKEVQSSLWRKRYDFSRADKVLKDLKLKLSFKPSPATAQGKKDTAAAAPATEPAASEAGADDAAAAPPEAKRQKTESGPAADSGAERANGAPDAATATDTAPVVEVAMSDEAAGAKTAGDEVKSAVAAAVAVANSDRSQGHVEVPLRPEEKRVIDFKGKTVLAPLTTVGNLPFRRVCKQLGADVTIGEMALCTNLLQGQASEWALLKRHPSEDLFGVQIAGGFPDAVARTCQLIDECTQSVDFVDINMGCPIDIVCDRGAGSALLLKPKRIEEIARAAGRSMSLPLTLKTRKGYYDDKDVTHTFVDQIRSWGPMALTLHGRTRQQRYSRAADWQYIEQCAQLATPTGLQLIGNGDVFSYTDWNDHVGNGEGPLTSCMIGRGALIKPWVFTEIKEQRHWDISAGERLDMLKSFCSAGLQHWGSDGRGVDNTRRFLLEWLSYTHRYVPVGLLEVVPQRMHWRVPSVYGRSDLETLLLSDNPGDWIKISEMLLGPVKSGFTFTPKHKSQAYSSSNATTQAAAEEDQAEG